MLAVFRITNLTATPSRFCSAFRVFFRPLVGPTESRVDHLHTGYFSTVGIFCTFATCKFLLNAQGIIWSWGTTNLYGPEAQPIQSPTRTCKLRRLQKISKYEMVERDLVVGPISNVNMYVFFFLLIALHHMSVSFVEDKLGHYIKRVLFVCNWCMMAYTTPLGVQWSTGFVEREKWEH